MKKCNQLMTRAMNQRAENRSVKHEKLKKRILRDLMIKNRWLFAHKMKNCDKRKN